MSLADLAFSSGSGGLGGSSHLSSALSLPSGSGGTSSSQQRSLLSESHELGEDIFSVERVEYTPPSRIKILRVCSGVIAIGLDDSRLALFDLDSARNIEIIQLGAPIHQLFLDPTGYHLLICLINQQTFYVNYTWPRPRKPRHLPLLNGKTYNCVAFDLANRDRTSTHEILIGSSDGVVWRAFIETKSDASFAEMRYLKSAFVLLDANGLNTSSTVTGLHWLRFEDAPRRVKCFFVVVATPTRLYQFFGSGSLTATFAEANPIYQEMLGPLDSYLLPNLCVSAATASGSVPLIWATAQGLFYGEIALKPTGLGETILVDTKLIPYPTEPSDSSSSNSSSSSSTSSSSTSSSSSSTSSTDGGFDMPKAVHLTPFHFMVLWPSSLQVVSSISLEVVMTNLRPGEVALRNFAYDRLAGTLWAFSDRSVFEITIRDEGKHVWNLYLKQGMYALALKFAQTSQQRSVIQASQADHYFRRGDFINAARLDACTDQSFQDVALKYLHRNRDALKTYLLTKLSMISQLSDSDAPPSSSPSSSSSSSSSLSSSDGGKEGSSWPTQRTMICTWLIELYLRKLNRMGLLLRDTKPITHEFHEFLCKYRECLDPRTTLKLVGGAGRSEDLLFCYALFNMHEKVVEQLSRQSSAMFAKDGILLYDQRTEPYRRALQIIQRDILPTAKDGVEIAYRYSPVLFAQMPYETLNFWIQLGPSRISPTRLLPSLARYNIRHNHPDHPENQVLRFLRICCSRAWNCRDSAVHDYLFSLSVRERDEDHIIAMLNSAASDKSSAILCLFDLSFALRLCMQHKKLRCAVLIYQKMELYDEAVDLALRVDIDLAKLIAANKSSDIDEAVRRRLWLKIVHHVIRYDENVLRAIELIGQCNGLIRIEDIMPSLPDTVLIDDFKEEICRSLVGYNQRIEELRNAIKNATEATKTVRQELAQLKDKSVSLNASQKCGLCSALLATRQFYLFPCQHAFHTDCLLQESVRRSTAERRGGRAGAPQTSKITDGCLLCGDSMISAIDEPFCTAAELESWSI